MFYFLYTGTNLNKRQGEEGVNKLDAACKAHDIEYQTKTDRYLADKNLEKEAAKRIVASDSSFGERMASTGVFLTMKAKRMLAKSRQRRAKRNTRKPKVNRKKTGGKSTARKRPRKTRIIETPSSIIS